MKKRVFRVQSKIKYAVCVLALLVSAGYFTGCRDGFSAKPPVLKPPTPNIDTVTTPGSDNENINTPDPELEIHFNDINLENAVRTKIGKSMGVITRSDVEDIKALSARVQGITNIDALSYFVNLEELDLTGNRITDFSPLSQLTSLKKLNISKNYNVVSGASGASGLDISFLKTLLLLEELDASDNMLSDITPVSYLVSLKKLTLSRNRITDIMPIASCRALTYIDLSYNYGINADNTERGISDLSPLFQCTELTQLIASHNLISRTEGIEALGNLVYIDLEDNYVDSLESLAKVSRLETLLMHGNSLLSIDPLTDNKTVSVLDVSLNMISDFTPIRTMSALEKLVWEQNNIKDYTPIDEFVAAHP